MKRYTIYSIGLFSLMVMSSCDRMPLYELEKKVELLLELNLELDLDIDVTVDVDVEVKTQIDIPEMMQVGFYSPDGTALQNTQFVGATGGKINTPPGTYRMVIYSFGNEYTQVRGEQSVQTLEAFTSDITATKMAALQKALSAAEANTRAEEDEQPTGPIIYSPDHLLVTVEEVTIPEFTQESQTITIESTVQTICETYSFEVHTVIGTEYVESCEAFVTNQASSSFFGRDEISQDPATIWFPVGVDRNKGCLYTVFNTFGKLPGDSRAFIHFIIRDVKGNEHYFSADITQEFERTDNHIVIDEPVEIPEPEYASGGIAPSVEEWEEENNDVNIG